MGLSIGPTIGVDGAEKFQLAFKEMAAAAGSLQSQMDAVTASFRANDSALKTNKAIAEQLTKQISEQQRIYDKATEGYQKSKQAIYDAAKAIEQSKKDYEAATPVLQIFKAQYQEAVNIEERQKQVVEEVNGRLQEEIAVREDMMRSYNAGALILSNEVALHEQLIAKGSELVTTYNTAKTAYDQAVQALDKNNAALSKLEETHSTYATQIDASNQRIANLKEQYDTLTTAVKFYSEEVKRAEEAANREWAEHGRDSEQAKIARAERDALKATLKDFQTELNNVSKALNKEEQDLAKIEKADAEVQKQTEALEDKYVELDDTVKEAEKTLNGAADALNKEKDAARDARQELEDFNKAHGKASPEIQEVDKNIEALKKELDSEKKTLSENTKETEAHRKALNGAQKELDGLEKAIGTAEKRLDVAKVTAQKWGDVMYTAKAKLEEFKKKLEELPKTLESVSEDAIKSGEALSDIGEGLTKVLSPMTALSAYGVKSAMTFTDALAKISTIADTSIVSLEQYGDGIVEIANQTGFATSDIAAATYQALSAAVSTENSLEFVAGAADLARAGFLDMYGSVDVLTTILNAYHKDVSEVSHISDVLVKVQDRGKTTVNELAGAMGNVIPTAAQYGISLEDLGAAYVVLTKQGINTARTTTYLRSAFTELEKTNSDSAKALEKATGKTFMQLMKEGKSLGEVMQILKDYVHGDEEAFIHLFGSIRTAAGALALANTTSAEYAEILDDVSNSSGQAARNVEKLQTPSLKLKKAWEQMKNTGMELGEEMLDTLMPAIEGVVRGAKSLSSWFKNLHKSTKRLMAIFAGIAGVIGPVVTGVGKAIVGFGKFAKAMSLLFKVSTPLIVSMGAWAGVLTAVAAASAVVALQMNEQRERYNDMMKSYWGLTDAQKEHIESSKTLVEQAKDIRQTAYENAVAHETEAHSAMVLLGQLRDLYDANGKVKEGNETQAEIIKGMLADAMGMQIDDLDKIISKYGIYSDSIDNIIDQMKKEAEAEVFKEAYKEQLKSIISLQRNRAQLEDDLAAAQERANRTSEAKKIAQERVAEAQREHINLTKQEGLLIQDAINADNEAQAALREVKSAYNETNDAIDESIDNMEYYVQQLMTTQGMSREEAEKTAEEWAKAYRKEAKEGNLAATEAERSAQKAEKAHADALDNMKRKAAEKMPEIAAEFDIDLSSQANNAANSWIDALVSPANIGKSAGAGHKLAQAALDSVSATIREGSPSKVMIEKGNNFSQGFIIGMEELLPDVSNMGAMVASAAIPDTSWTSNYSRLPDSAYGTTNNTRNISAPIAVNVNVNGSVDDPNALADVIEQRLVEKIINNERAFA